MIGSLIKSIKDINYREDHLHVQFVADHCTDLTVDKIRNEGFDVLIREEGEGSKTESLIAGLTSLMNKHGEKIEAIAFFDADNIIDPQFFNVIAGQLESGANIIQGRVGIHNRYATVFTSLNYINGEVENRFTELARSNAGFTCHLRGHGMVFSKQVLMDTGLNADSLVEDQELLVRLVLEGKRVVWEQGAVVNSVMPESTGEATAQRRRWAGGKTAITGKSVKALFKKWITDHDWVAFDLMLDFLIPSHAIQLSLVFIAIVGSGLFVGVASSIFYASVSLLLLYTIYFLSGALLNGVPLKLFSIIIVAPFYIAWRTWIFLTSIRGVQKWR